ncbi:hypothetical protein [Phormidesmis priestleyi]
MSKTNAMSSGTSAAIAVSFSDPVSDALNNPAALLKWADTMSVVSMATHANKSVLTE